MDKKIKFVAVILVVVLILIITILILMAIATTPPRVRQIITLSTFRDCIWYGFDGGVTFSESDGEKKKIILPDSLTDYTPIVVRFGLKELESFIEKCDLIYNPNPA